jgi:hypothetical protein
MALVALISNKVVQTIESREISKVLLFLTKETVVIKGPSN